MKIKFIDTAYIPISYFNSKDDKHPDNTSLDKTQLKDGRDYRLLGTAEKNYSFGRRVWLGIRSFAKTVFTLGYLCNEKVKEDWNAFLTSKRTIAFYTNFPLKTQETSEKVQKHAQSIQPPQDASHESSDKIFHSPHLKLPTDVSAQPPALSSDDKSEQSKEIPVATSQPIPEELDSDCFIKAKLDINKLLPNTDLTLFKNEKELDLSQAQFPISKATLENVLHQIPHLQTIILPKTFEDKHVNWKPLTSLEAKLDAFEMMRFLLAYRPAFLSQLNLQGATKLLAHLDKEESIKLFKELSKANSQEDMRKFIQDSIRSGEKTPYFYSTCINILNIFKSLDDTQLAIYYSALMEFPNFLEIRDDFLSFIPLDRFKTLVNLLDTDALMRLSKEFHLSSLENKKTKLNIVLTKVMEQFDPSLTKKEIVQILKKNPVKWAILISHLEV